MIEQNQDTPLTAISQNGGPNGTWLIMKVDLFVDRIFQ